MGERRPEQPGCRRRLARHRTARITRACRVQPSGATEMARGPVRIGSYDSRTRPSGARQPYVRPVDTTTNIDRGLAQVGQTLQAGAEALARREEDDARVYTAS